MSDASRRVSVLIADDEPRMRKSLAFLLSHEGCDVATASNGRIAVEMCQQGQYAIVFLDVHMPCLDGIEAFRQIRKRWEGIRVVLMSADVSDGVKQTVLDESATAVLDKPLKLDQLLRCLSGAFDLGVNG